MSAHLNVHTSTVINGRRVAIPLVGGLGFDNLEAPEPWMDRLLPPLLEHRTGAFVDVGVNVGQTLLKVKTLAPDRPYYGFDPNPACFNYARRLVQLNGFTDCTLYPVGLSDRTRTLPLFARHEADVSASVVAGFRRTERSPVLMHVAVFEGDTVLEEAGRPLVGILKVDVEGGELEVLQGLRATLARDRPFIICEILPVYSATSEQGRLRIRRQEQLLAALAALEYVVFRIPRSAPLQRIDAIECHADMALTNYVFVPVEECAYVEHGLAAARR